MFQKWLKHILYSLNFVKSLEEKKFSILYKEYYGKYFHIVKLFKRYRIDQSFSISVPHCHNRVVRRFQMYRMNSIEFFFSFPRYWAIFLKSLKKCMKIPFPHMLLEIVDHLKSSCLKNFRPQEMWLEFVLKYLKSLLKILTAYTFEEVEGNKKKIFFPFSYLSRKVEKIAFCDKHISMKTLYQAGNQVSGKEYMPPSCTRF